MGLDCVLMPGRNVILARARARGRVNIFALPFEEQLCRAGERLVV